MRRLHEDNRSLASVSRTLQSQVESLAAANATAPARVEGLTVELSSERERCSRAVKEVRRLEESLKESLAAGERMRAYCGELESRMALLEGGQQRRGASEAAQSGEGAAVRRSVPSPDSGATKRPPFFPAMKKVAQNQRSNSRGNLASAGGGGGGGGGSSSSGGAGSRNARSGSGGIQSRANHEALARTQALEARLNELEAAVAAKRQASPTVHSPPSAANDYQPLFVRKQDDLSDVSPTRTLKLSSLSPGISKGNLPGDWPVMPLESQNIRTQPPTFSSGSPSRMHASDLAPSSSPVADTAALSSTTHSEPILHSSAAHGRSSPPAPVPTAPAAAPIPAATIPAPVPSVRPAPVEATFFGTPAVSEAAASKPAQRARDPLLDDDDDDFDTGYVPTSAVAAARASVQQPAGMRRPPPQFAAQTSFANDGMNWGAPPKPSFNDEDLPEERL